MAQQAPRTPRSLLVPVAALVACALLWPALITFDPGDWPSPNQFPHNNPTTNLCGPAGAWIAYQLNHLFGAGTYPLMLFITLITLFKAFGRQVENRAERAFGVICLVAATSASMYLIPGTSVMPIGAGGLAGNLLGELLAQNLSVLGTVIILVATFFVGLLFATDGWILRLPGDLRHAGGWILEAIGQARPDRGVSRAERAALVEEKSAPIRSRRTSKRRKQQTDDELLFVDPNDQPEDADEPASPVDEASDDDEEEYEYEYVEEEEDEAGVGAEPDEVLAEDKPLSKQQAAKLRKAAGPIVNYPTPEKTAMAQAYPKAIENWVLPSVDLLRPPEYGFNERQEEIVREQAVVLENTLQEFRLDARVVEIDTGPVITMFELKLGAGIKVSQIVSLSNDIARALKAHAIRVVAPIHGKNTVGIEVPNVEKECVRLSELMAQAGKKAANMNLPLFLGKDAGGGALVSDLTRMPHVLIAGTTGSGKSVCLNAIILSMLMTKRPDHVKMIMVDPKMVEMSQFKDVPHLMCPIVTDMAHAERILEWAVTKMEERYALFAEARVKNISGYNALGAEEVFKRLDADSDAEKARITTHLPYIVLVIDELADLMMTAAKEVEHHLSRLAQKSRAVGMHIIVATQRPEAKVVTGLIKSNLPSRICFRVSSRTDSRIVLDRNGGEVLMGQGDMLFLPPGVHKLLRSQGTYLEDDEVQAVLDDLASRAKPEFHPELTKLSMVDASGGSGPKDPLFDDAVRIVLETRRGSVSLLQRRLTIGYSRASRLIDQMSEAGIVGEYKGSQAREVTLTLEQWESLQAQVASDMEQGYEADEEDFGVDDAPELPFDADDADDQSASTDQDEEQAEADDDDDSEDEEVEEEIEYEYEYEEEDEGVRSPQK